MKTERIVIVGGGAAGFFAAIACAEARPDNEVIILERGSQFLTKVRISGGGRCNVTHTAMDARTFSARYPRGERALIGALHRFSPEDTVAWFEQRGVRLKVEPDGRMFPITDSSGTVIDCLLFEAKAAGVRLIPRTGVEGARVLASGKFELATRPAVVVVAGVGDPGSRAQGSALAGVTDPGYSSGLICDRLLLATGGARSATGAEIAQSLGHSVAAPVASLFSLHIAAPWLQSLPGVAVADAEISVPGTGLRERGPVLITHNGVSGPAVLRISAWGARILAECDYKFTLRINWLPALTAAEIADEIQSGRATQPRRRVANSPIAPLPARLWEQLVGEATISSETIWTTLKRADASSLVELLNRTELAVNGKSLNKDEFVTCGGVRLPEVNFKTMESRIVPHLYFAGELLDLDGITGGFNFQAAWTTGWIAGRAMADAGL